MDTPEYEFGGTSLAYVLIPAWSEEKLRDSW